MLSKPILITMPWQWKIIRKFPFPSPSFSLLKHFFLSSDKPRKIEPTFHNCIQSMKINSLKKKKNYPFAHSTELAGCELVASRFLEAKHEELTFELNHLLVDFFGGFGSDFLHLFFSLGHHHHRRRRARPPKRRRWETNDSVRARALESQAIEGGLGDWREQLCGECNRWRWSYGDCAQHRCSASICLSTSVLLALGCR